MFLNRLNNIFFNSHIHSQLPNGRQMLLNRKPGQTYIWNPETEKVVVMEGDEEEIERQLQAVAEVSFFTKHALKHNKQTEKVVKDEEAIQRQLQRAEAVFF